eukprot:2161667-Prymnesium_polylepis.1
MKNTKAALAALRGQGGRHAFVSSNPLEFRGNGMARLQEALQTISVLPRLPRSRVGRTSDAIDPTPPTTPSTRGVFARSV